MKSIIQEASSLGKAIEQGWIKLGKPQDFSIRILEEPQRNFLGLTTRSAKVALFVGVGREKAEQHETKITMQPQRRPQHVQRERREQFIREQERPQQETLPEQKARQQKHVEGKERGEQRPQWNDAMINHAQAWLTTSLNALDLEDISFTIEPQNYYLRITLSKPLLPEHEKERRLLATFATLLLETLKRQFKTNLRGHKIVLTHAS